MLEEFVGLGLRNKSGRRGIGVKWWRIQNAFSWRWWLGWRITKEMWQVPGGSGRNAKDD